MIYPFVENPCDVVEELKTKKAYKAFSLLEEKGYKKLTKNEKAFVNSYFKELWNSETYCNGIYKISGWVIDFGFHLKKYLVHFKYYGWKEIKAFNKTCIRQNAVNPSYVLEIIEKP